MRTYSDKSGCQFKLVTNIFLYVCFCTFLFYLQYLLNNYRLHFRLGNSFNKSKYVDVSLQESPQDSMVYAPKTSTSGSETEDENWRKKIEAGAYTEKVKQKSRSVADLMILTHIDYSESDSETLPSLESNKTSSKYLRYGNRGSENTSIKFGSEGNLLNVQETFQDELKKLQEEKKDSLLFVPDRFSFNISGDSSKTQEPSTTSIIDSPVKKLIEELNSPAEIIPPKQIYNVFNVSVEKIYNPLQFSKRTEENIPRSGKSHDVNIEMNEKGSNDVHQLEVCEDDKLVKELQKNDFGGKFVEGDLKLMPKLIQKDLLYSIQNIGNFGICLEGDSKNKDKLQSIDKDSGLNTPENSASLEKLDDDSEDLLNESHNSVLCNLAPHLTFRDGAKRIDYLDIENCKIAYDENSKKREIHHSSLEDVKSSFETLGVAPEMISTRKGSDISNGEWIHCKSKDNNLNQEQFVNVVGDVTENGVNQSIGEVGTNSCDNQNQICIKTLENIRNLESTLEDVKVFFNIHQSDEGNLHTGANSGTKQNSLIAKETQTDIELMYVNKNKFELNTEIEPQLTHQNINNGICCSVYEPEKQNDGLQNSKYCETSATVQTMSHDMQIALLNKIASEYLDEDIDCVNLITDSKCSIFDDNVSQDDIGSTKQFLLMEQKNYHVSKIDGNRVTVSDYTPSVDSSVIMCNDTNISNGSGFILNELSPNAVHVDLALQDLKEFSDSASFKDESFDSLTNFNVNSEEVYLSSELQTEDVENQLKCSEIENDVTTDLGSEETFPGSNYVDDVPLTNTNTVVNSNQIVTIIPNTLSSTFTDISPKKENRFNVQCTKNKGLCCVNLENTDKEVGVISLKEMCRRTLSSLETELYTNQDFDVEISPHTSNFIDKKNKIFPGRTETVEFPNRRNEPSVEVDTIPEDIQSNFINKTRAFLDTEITNYESSKHLSTGHQIKETQQSFINSFENLPIEENKSNEFRKQISIPETKDFLCREVETYVDVINFLNVNQHHSEDTVFVEAGSCSNEYIDGKNSSYIIKNDCENEIERCDGSNCSNKIENYQLTNCLKPTKFSSEELNLSTLITEDVAERKYTLEDASHDKRDSSREIRNCVEINSLNNLENSDEEKSSLNDIKINFNADWSEYIQEYKEKNEDIEELEPSSIIEECNDNKDFLRENSTCHEINGCEINESINSIIDIENNTGKSSSCDESTHFQCNKDINAQNKLEKPQFEDVTTNFISGKDGKCNQCISSINYQDEQNDSKENEDYRKCNLIESECCRDIISLEIQGNDSSLIENDARTVLNEISSNQFVLCTTTDFLNNERYNQVEDSSRNVEPHENIELSINNDTFVKEPIIKYELSEEPSILKNDIIEMQQNRLCSTESDGKQSLDEWFSLSESFTNTEVQDTNEVEQKINDNKNVFLKLEFQSHEEQGKLTDVKLSTVENSNEAEQLPISVTDKNVTNNKSTLECINNVHNCTENTLDVNNQTSFAVAKVCDKNITTNFLNEERHLSESVRSLPFPNFNQKQLEVTPGIKLFSYENSEPTELAIEVNMNNFNSDVSSVEIYDKSSNLNDGVHFEENSIYDTSTMGGFLGEENIFEIIPEKSSKSSLVSPDLTNTLQEFSMDAKLISDDNLSKGKEFTIEVNLVNEDPKHNFNTDDVSPVDNYSTGHKTSDINVEQKNVFQKHETTCKNVIEQHSKAPLSTDLCKKQEELSPSSKLLLSENSNKEEESLELTTGVNLTRLNDTDVNSVEDNDVIQCDVNNQQIFLDNKNVTTDFLKKEKMFGNITGNFSKLPSDHNTNQQELSPLPVVKNENELSELIIGVNVAREGLILNSINTDVNINDRINVANVSVCDKNKINNHLSKEEIYASKNVTEEPSETLISFDLDMNQQEILPLINLLPEDNSKAMKEPSKLLVEVNSAKESSIPSDINAGVNTVNEHATVSGQQINLLDDSICDKNLTRECLSEEENKSNCAKEFSKPLVSFDLDMNQQEILPLIKLLPEDNSRETKEPSKLSIEVNSTKESSIPSDINADVDIVNEHATISDHQINLLDDSICDKNLTKHFLSEEENKSNCAKELSKPLVSFDLSENQQEIAPNSLTHLSAFASTPFVKHCAESKVILGASDDYSIDFYSGLKSTIDDAENTMRFSSNFVQDGERISLAQKLFTDNRDCEQTDLYSLETWDTFLGRSFDNDKDHNVDFCNFSDEPQSLLFLDDINLKETDNDHENITYKKEQCDQVDEKNLLTSPNCTEETHIPEQELPNKTFTKLLNNETYVKDDELDASITNATFNVELSKETANLESTSGGSWETGGGWFLHPQNNLEEPSGKMEVTKENVPDTYVSFNVDDEIMTAIRNELLTKLPHAQVSFILILLRCKYKTFYRELQVNKYRKTKS